MPIPIILLALILLLPPKPLTGCIPRRVSNLGPPLSKLVIPAIFTTFAPFLVGFPLAAICWLATTLLNKLEIRRTTLTFRSCSLFFELKLGFLRKRVFWGLSARCGTMVILNEILNSDKRNMLLRGGISPERWANNYVTAVFGVWNRSSWTA